jgi:SOS response regulatory protein OraA/RecX
MDFYRFLLDKAYRLLGVRDFSTLEMEQKLDLAMDKFETIDQISPEQQTAVLDAVLQDLKDKHLLDDLKFTRSFVQSRLAHKPRGKFLLRQELQTKGIPPDIIDQVFDETMDHDTQLELALRLLAKRRNKTTEQNARYLQSKGFDFETVRKAVFDS